MPAETHSHSEPVTVEAVLELLATVVHDDDGLDPATPVEVLGLDDDLALMAFWDVVSEEYSERGLGEADLEQLMECRTVIELAQSTARCLGVDRTGSTDEALREAGST